MDAIEWITLALYVALIVAAIYAGARFGQWLVDRRKDGR